MERTEALRNLLEDLTAVYNDGERLDVAFDSSSYARPDETVVVAPNVRDALGRSLSGTDELRCLTNTLSHEVEHVRESVLTGKKEFSEEYPAYPNVAGTVINIVEDQYVDWSRCRRFKGLRKSQAFVIDVLMDNHHRRPRIDGLRREEQLVEGFLQVAFAGYAKGIRDVEADEVREFLAWARRHVKAARRNPDPDEREQVAREITDRMLALFPERETIDLTALADLLDGLPTDPAAGGMGAASAPDPALATDEPDEEGDGDEHSDAGDGDGDAGLDDELAEMDDMDGQRASSNWYSVDDEDYERPDSVDESRYERLRRAVEEGRTDLGERRRERDRRIEANRALTGEAALVAPCERVRTYLRESNLAREVEEAFRKLTTQDHPEPATAGDEVDIDGYVRHRAGDYEEDELYIHRQQVETGDRAVAVTLDLSGSMSELDAKASLGALWVATHAIGDDFMASGYRTTAVHNIVTELITAPGEDFEWDHLDSVYADGLTPTSAGVADATRLVKEATKRERLVICITDGKANVEDWEGYRRKHDPPNDFESSDSGEQVLEAVQRARAAGIKVIALGVGRASESRLREQFGEHGYVMAGKGGLTDALIETYRRQLKTTRDD